MSPKDRVSDLLLNFWLKFWAFPDRWFYQQAARLASVKEGDRVLDVGCGTGFLAIILKKMAGGSGDVKGIDPASKRLEKARRRAEKVGLDIDFREGSIEHIPFEDNLFDVVTSTFMFHHLSIGLKKEGLREVQRVLKPEGHLLVADFDRVLNPSVGLFLWPFCLFDEGVRLHARGKLLEFFKKAGFTEVKLIKRRAGSISFIDLRK